MSLLLTQASLPFYEGIVEHVFLRNQRSEYTPQVTLAFLFEGHFVRSLRVPHSLGELECLIRGPKHRLYLNLVFHSFLFFLQLPIIQEVPLT